MSRPRFLADHDLNEHIVEGVLLREPTAVFLQLRDVGLANRPDPDVLEYAAVHDLLLVSHDVSTMPACAYNRLAKGQSVTGVFIARQMQAIAPVIDHLVLIWSASETEDWRDRVVFLPFK